MYVTEESSGTLSTQVDSALSETLHLLWGQEQDVLTSFEDLG